MAEQANVDGGRVVARRVLKSKYVLPEPSGKQRVLLSAFEEIRPGGLSLDALWFSNAGISKQDRILSAAFQVAAKEGHSVVGWATFTAQTVLIKERHSVERIVESGTLTNPKHADLISRQVLRIEEGDAPDIAEDKAHILAKLLAEFCSEHGEFYPAPSPAPIDMRLATPAHTK